ncbi:hypothetical protein GBA52_026237 [Prunus armeniaca]|nr:hypothetical protein GBA52_026237 [Prunus armeniaca]
MGRGTSGNRSPTNEGYYIFTQKKERSEQIENGASELNLSDRLLRRESMLFVVFFVYVVSISRFSPNIIIHQKD